MQNPDQLPEAPGARASRLCGIWALVMVVPFFPASLILAIIAIVRNLTARSRAGKAPQAYRMPSRAGMIMGAASILAVPVFVFFAGVTVFVVMSRRTWAKDQAAVAHLSSTLPELAAKCASGATVEKLEAQLRDGRAELRNPWNPGAPAFEYTLPVLSGLDEGGIREAARLRATTLGQTVFVVQLPVRSASAPRKGFVAGAVRTRAAIGESPVTLQVMAVD